MVYILVYLSSGEVYSIYDILLYIIGIKLINTNMWYIINIIILYLAFYFLFKYSKVNKAIIGIGLVTIFYCLVCIKIGKGIWWYNSTFCFFIGILFGKYKKSFFSFIKKGYVIVVFSLTTLFLILFILGTSPNSTFSTFASSLFILLIVTLLMKVEIKNKAIQLLGNISYEIYLVHGIILNKLGVINNKYLYFFLCIIITIISAYLFNIFLKQIFNILNNLSYKK